MTASVGQGERKGINIMKQKHGAKTALTILAATVLLAAVIVCDSKYNLQVTEYDLGFNNLPESFEGFKVLHLSDLHGMSFGKDNRRLIEQVLRQKPDLIAMTGDIAGKDGDLAAVEALLKGLEGAAPMYYVNGNHEWADGCVDEIEALMERYGAHCLSNEFELLYNDEGDSIVVIGAEDPNGRADMIKPWGLSLKVGELYSDKFKLWLAHRNDYLTMYSDIGTDLILCGHAHGGIIRLPFVGGLLDVHHTIGAEYDSGIYDSEHFVMEVSRGLGNSIPIPRIFNRPELAVITLHSY